MPNKNNEGVNKSVFINGEPGIIKKTVLTLTSIHSLRFSHHF